MENLRSLVFGDKPRVATVEGDIVYPTAFMDNQDTIQNMVLASTWLFDDVLDGDKINNALVRLLDRDDWRKLGGRYRQGKGRKLEMHVPAVFTPERPAVWYTQETFDLSIEEHPLFDAIPRSTDARPSLQPSSQLLLPLMRRPGAPEVIGDFLESDAPPLSLHIVHFVDATMVTLAWPHPLMDATGLSILVCNWTLVLARRDAEVGPFMGARSDILHDATGTEAATEEEDCRAHDRMGALQMLLFALLMLWGMLWERVESRVLYVPKETVQKLRATCLTEIGKHGDDDKGETPWISESDAILAMWSKAMVQGQTKPRPIIVINPFEVRSRLPGFMAPQDNYIQNATTACSETITADLSTGHMGLIAQKLRRALEEQTKPAQVLARLRTQRVQWHAGRDTMFLYGPSHAQLLAATNWGKAKLFHVADFGPAVVKAGRREDAEKASTNPPGTPSGFCTAMLRPGPLVRNALSQLGKDRAGNLWFMGFFTKSVWDNVLETLERL